MPGISIPESSSSIVNLLKVLATGIAISNIKSDLQVVSRTAETMNIQIGNWQIGVKNRSGGKNSKQEKKDMGKKTKKSDEKKTEPSVKSEIAENSKEQDKKHSCEECGKQFGRKDHLKKHLNTHQRFYRHFLPLPHLLATHHQHRRINDINISELQ